VESSVGNLGAMSKHQDQPVEDSQPTEEEINKKMRDEAEKERKEHEELAFREGR